MKPNAYEAEDAVTPAHVFFNRRQFVKAAAATAIGASIPTFCAGSSVREDEDQRDAILKPTLARPDVFPAKRNGSYPLPNQVRGQGLTEPLVAGTHNNFYEFLPGKGGPVWRYTDDFTTQGWKLEVTGACENPHTMSLDDIFTFPHEERLYHFRCVERWAMNVPWTGFPLAKLIEKAKPSPRAKYVAFTSAMRTTQMPGLIKSRHYPWPYHEALRLDEARNELALLVTGVYGQPLPAQHGAPIRLIVPWKYGYKNPKSLVKIEFLEKQPKTFWQVQPHEYGFLSNVNPNIPHPRWSQERSKWLGQRNAWFPTPLFNGYESYVAALYPDEPRTPQEPLRPGQIAR